MSGPRAKCLSWTQGHTQKCLTGLARLALEEMGAKGMAGERFSLQTSLGLSLLLCVPWFQVM